MAIGSGGDAKAEEGEEDEMNAFFNTHFLVLNGRNFQKSSIWLDLVVAFCAMRAANPFSVFLAYTCFILRVVQFIGVIIQKERMSEISYFLATFLMIMMWFTDFAKEAADIIHEARPPDEVIKAAHNEGLYRL